MFLIFDTETTGLPRHRGAALSDVENWPRLVQIAWLRYDAGGSLVDSRSAIIRPEGFTIPNEAARVHGITQQRAVEEGQPLNRVLEEFTAAVDISEILVAHNMEFDEKIVGAELLRWEIPSRMFDKKRVCTMVSATEYCQIPGPYGFKWPTLAELYNVLFRVTFNETHDAELDVKACAECFFELMNLGLA